MENGLPNIGAPSDMMDAGATYKERINLEDTHDTQTNLFNDESPNGGDDMVDRGHTVGEEGTLHIEANDGDHVGGTKGSLDRGPPDTESHNDRSSVARPRYHMAWGRGDTGRRASVDGHLKVDSVEKFEPPPP